MKDCNKLRDVLRDHDGHTQNRGVINMISYDDHISVNRQKGLELMHSHVCNGLG